MLLRKQPSSLWRITFFKFLFYTSNHQNRALSVSSSFSEFDSDLIEWGLNNSAIPESEGWGQWGGGKSSVIGPSASRGWRGREERERERERERWTFMNRKRCEGGPMGCAWKERWGIVIQYSEPPPQPRTIKPEIWKRSEAINSVKLSSSIKKPGWTPLSFVSPVKSSYKFIKTERNWATTECSGLSKEKGYKEIIFSLLNPFKILSIQGNPVIFSKTVSQPFFPLHNPEKVRKTRPRIK